MNGWYWDVPSLISQDEEDELAAKSFNGDYEARVRLAMSNLRMVLFCAAAAAKTPTERQDLIGEGLNGVWVAATRYDPSHNVKFCTYATWWIRSFIVQHKKQSSRLMMYAPNTFKMYRELAKLYAETGRGISDEVIRRDVAARLDVSEERLQNLWNSSVTSLRLDAPIDETGRTLSDFVASESMSPEEECARNEELSIAQSTINSAMSFLTNKEALVVRMSIIGDATFSEAGAKLGVSKQRAKQICDKAVAKMRDHVSCSNFHVQ